MEPQASYRLLLVEDSEEQRLIVEQMLLQIDSERYQVDSAATYAEALTFIQRHSYCLLYTSPSPRDATLARMPSSA